MSIYPAGYGLNKYDLFWRKISQGEFIRVGAAVSNSTADLYICPSNRRAYIFALYISWYLASATHFYVYITDASNNVFYIVHQASTTGISAIYDVIPLNPGDKLSVQAAGTGAYGKLTALIVEV